ncbi:DsbA family protein [Streptomyces sp. CA-278952]|uniref:2-hydroxychromene-2-carboxylate isomerase n=1 Tax=Streptomyces sp. CA-278952 TaxID=2980556 RepID=UPI002367FA9D|nr:DsbA family protein [Streptomyces sp. CA-278952]WDG27624.1 DsbA family protein [Streptomyces sp. CA-278952]
MSEAGSGDKEVRAARTRTPAPPRFYFSLRSPYSWLAYRDLGERHAAFADRLEWRPFFEPDERSAKALAEAGGSFSYVAMSREKHLYILQDIRRLTRERGLEITWPIDRDPCWEVPHLAYLAALDEGRGAGFIDLAHRARWEEGRDICDRAVMGELAEELGLGPDRLALAADDPLLRARGVEALLAMDRDGVFGVPFFVNRRDKYWGIDRLDAFVAAVNDAPDRKPAPTAPPQASVVPDGVMGGDGGHAGGCG